MATKSFFTRAVVEQQRRVAPKRTERRLRPLTCSDCKLLNAGAYSPQMDVMGKGRMGILVIAQQPGKDEDENGDILCGPSGQLLTKELRRLGVDLEDDCWRINAINCYPKGVQVTPKHVECCRSVKVFPALEKLKPKYVLLLGTPALKSFWGLRRTQLSVTRYRGRAYPDLQRECWVFSTFNPAALLRNEEEGDERVDETMASLFARDLKRFVRDTCRRPPPVREDYAAELKMVFSEQEALGELDRLEQYKGDLVFDYETTGICPVLPDHKILILSFATRSSDARFGWRPVAMPVDYPGAFRPAVVDEVKHRFGGVLASGRVRLVAHNMQFEDFWSRVKLGVTPRGWHQCTMNTAHLLDNTKGTTGLKWQVAARWGVDDYDAAVGSYIRGREGDDERTSSHSFNRMASFPLRNALEYAGLDALFEAMLLDAQEEELDNAPSMAPAFNLFHEALDTFCDLQVQGVHIDVEHMRAATSVLEGKQREKMAELLAHPASKLFRQAHGRFPDIEKREEVSELLYKFAGLQPPKKTGTGMPSVDAESLGMLKHPVASGIVAVRKSEKLVGTYFNQILRETVDGKVYPMTNFNRARTYRPSMQNPNFANLPKRDPEAGMLVRRAVLAPPGFGWLECDYSSIEVHGLEWYSLDRALSDYLHTPGADMHRDQTMLMFDIRSKSEWDGLDKKATKALRNWVKNQWVFPLFYGSWWKACMEHLWRKCMQLPIGDKDWTVREWMDTTEKRFADHVRDLEEEFWSKFRGVREYQESLKEEYARNGFLETYLGFRMGGTMSRNQLFNGKVQSTAFHVLLTALIELHRELRRGGFRTHIVWQIYDSIITAYAADELDDVVALYREVMVKRIMAKYKWINTPLAVEFETTAVGGTMADLKGLTETDNYEEDDGSADEEDAA